MTNEYEMLPCPFCGSEARWIEKSGWERGDCGSLRPGVGDVCCTNIHCYLADGADQLLPRADAVKLWNTRKLRAVVDDGQDWPPVVYRGPMEDD